MLEADPPHRLVTTFHMMMDPNTSAEPATKITHEIKEGPNGVCSLTLTHDLEGAPMLAAIVGGTLEDQGAGGGHAWVLSDLKTLLETGKSFRNLPAVDSFFRTGDKHHSFVLANVPANIEAARTGLLSSRGLFIDQ